MRSKENYLFKNWGRNLKHRTPFYYQPSTEQEFQSIIQRHKKIRVTGSGHSWSEVCLSEEVLVNLDRYNKILEVDREKKTVKTQAGIKMWQLNQQLRGYGLALQNQGSIDQQSIIGAISTGTHGTGISFPILGGQLLEIKIITADGEIRIINKEKDPELFKGCVVNLGALGIITEVTLQAVEGFNLHDHTTTLAFEEVIEKLPDFLAESDHFKIWWLPPTQKAVVYRYQRTQQPTNDNQLRRYLQDEVFSVAAYRSLVAGGRAFPKFKKGINRFLTSQIKPLDRIEECSRVFIVPEPPTHRECEWSFDAGRAQEILTAYRDFMRKHHFCLNFIQEIRFTQGDDFWLSGCHGRDSMWIGFYAFAHEKFEEKLRLFEEFACKFQGRPHWGKEFNVGPDYLKPLYPKFENFQELKKAWDPEGKFSNVFIHRIFG